MSKRKTSILDLLGLEAGMYVPPPTLGDTPPPPRSLRRAVAIVLILAIVAGVVAVQTIPSAAHTWRVVSHQTERVLDKVLGRAEFQTSRLVNGLTGEPPELPGQASPSR
jgi:hypothetical protein